MLAGIKFCGGCNPRYDRGKALETIKKQMQGKAEFVVVQEDTEYDVLLVIGGCTNCCASYSQYKAKKILTMWDESHIERTIEELINQYNETEKK